MNFSVSELTTRHRLSLAQIHRLGWGEVPNEELFEEKKHALLQANHIKHILDQLEETGIFFICIKGVALSQRLYQDPTVRYARDIDILVPDKKDVIFLRQQLLSNGWSDADDYWVDDEPRRDWYMDLAMHHVMIDPVNGFVLEIHWSLDRLLLNIDENELEDVLKSHTEKMMVYHRKINVLSPELELIYVIAHGTRHAWFRLKWLVDVHHYPVSMVDQKTFESLLRKYNACGFVTYTDELLRFYFGKGFPFSVDGNANSRVLTYYKSKILGDEEESAASAVNTFRMAMNVWRITGDRNKALNIIYSLLLIRPQDISRVKLNALWKYYFYRYYSFLKRRFFTEEVSELKIQNWKIED